MKLADKLVARNAIIGFLFLVTFFCFTSEIQAQSIIQGTVFDNQGNRLPDLDMELLDDLYRTKARTKTDGTGGYSFGGLPNGRYTIRVYAFRYDLEDKEQFLEINTQNIRGGEGAGYFIQDIYLQPKKGSLRESELGVVFAQEIPKEAQTLYEKAVKDLSEKRVAEGISALLGALKIFPDYYAALFRLGTELIVRNQFQDAARVFLKASSINQKSGASYYYLAYSLHKLGKEYDKAAKVAIGKSAVLAPGSVQVFWLYGKIERSLGNYNDAEKHLLQAKKLSNSRNPDVQIELVQLYSNEMKKYKEAADELELYIKAANLSSEDETKMKKIIADLREKAKTQT